MIKDEWGELNPINKLILEEYILGVKNKSVNHYIICISRDGETPPRSIISYNNAIDAVKVYNSYKDWGFAKNFLTVTLYEPNGNINEKKIIRPQGLDPVFMRKNYIDFSEIIKTLSNKLNKEDYEEFCVSVARIFSVDNQRFDEYRFFKNLGIIKD